ncbi:MAG: protein adenylyltransferase SelO family protein [Corynebacterium casei]|uniref:protein adenylyltransferase SelO family protein n=1 Tax=Corynebacterium casei TaxID=160386 RepID=UPI002649552D|nr:protein adenylyltransferase SelO family protein [Corynebacterium casei]MDN6464423.1 protein adenylyltransferase SelO family protein [Corynebacterium casei]
MKLQHSYAEALPDMVRAATGEEQPDPQLLILNEPLAAELGLDVDFLKSADGLKFLLGQSGEGHAMAYSGHQFGQLSPVLGDGRAILLGEIAGQDLHAKGTGKTPFSRPGSDGRGALGPMLREYLMSEAMQALGVPTTRGLAVISTGRKIQRDRVVPGAVMVRTAASHIRVGTMQYAAMTDQIKDVADFAIARHYPGEDYQGLFRKVMHAQAATVAKWQRLGFIHGVMNTDNTTLSGETIDYGPCAFMEQFDVNTYFSSIDPQGRYRYGNQPSILGWNLARLAETLLPLFDEDPNHAIDIANSTMAEFTDIMNGALETEDVQEVTGDITEENHKRDPNSPVTIPRNIPVDRALKQATDGDLSYYFELLEAVKKPSEHHPVLSLPGDLEGFITFCGT